jgi:hypothetical protein
MSNTIEVSQHTVAITGRAAGDASTAQARGMLGPLEGHLVGLACKLEMIEEECNRRTSTRGATLQRRHRTVLRRERHTDPSTAYIADSLKRPGDRTSTGRMVARSRS